MPSNRVTRAAAPVLLLVHALGCAAAPAGTPTQAAVAPPESFTANPNIGPGGSDFQDSAHFRVYGAQSAQTAEAALAMLEAAYDCFVGALGWRSSGLSFNGTQFIYCRTLDRLGTGRN